LEWERSEASTPTAENCLAVLALEQNRFSLETLANILSVDRTVVRATLSKVPFVAVGESDEDEVRFISESFRRFASRRLEDRRPWVREQLITYLMRDRASNESFRLLPRRLLDAGRPEEVLSLLNPTQLALFVDNAPSLRDVEEAAELGIAAARNLS